MCFIYFIYFKGYFTKDPKFLLRHYATSQKVEDSIPDEVTGFFKWPNPSSLTVSLGSDHVGFVVDKVALEQVFPEYFGFPCQFALHRLLHSHHHLSSGAGAVGQNSGHSTKWTHSHPMKKRIWEVTSDLRVWWPYYLCLWFVFEDPKVEFRCRFSLYSWCYIPQWCQCRNRTVNRLINVWEVKISRDKIAVFSLIPLESIRK
jgi:hypothetical protein